MSRAYSYTCSWCSELFTTKANQRCCSPECESGLTQDYQKKKEIVSNIKTVEVKKNKRIEKRNSHQRLTDRIKQLERINLNLKLRLNRVSYLKY